MKYRVTILGGGIRLKPTNSDELLRELLGACQFTVKILDLVRHHFEPSLKDQLPADEFEAIELALHSVQAWSEAAVRRAGLLL